MIKSLAALAVSGCLLVGSPAFADDFGSSAEAKAMLDKAVMALKTNKAEALTMFIKGEGRLKASGCGMSRTPDQRCQPDRMNPIARAE